jgi:hypothetical protein
VSRQAIACFLIALIALALAATIAWQAYYARDRTIGRRRQRDRWHGRAGENSEG